MTINHFCTKRIKISILNRKAARHNDITVKSLTLKFCRDAVVIMRNQVQLTVHLNERSCLEATTKDASALNPESKPV